jgi:hypothetical protein
LIGKIFDRGGDRSWSRRAKKDQKLRKNEGIDYLDGQRGNSAIKQLKIASKQLALHAKNKTNKPTS